MRFLLLSLFLGLAATAAATPPADTARQAKHRPTDRSRTGLEAYPGLVSQSLGWSGDSAAVAPVTAPERAEELLSPRAQARAIARERVRQGWGKQHGE